MARVVEVGVLLRADDQASPAIAQLAGKTARAEAAFGRFGASMISLNQTIGLLKKGYRLLDRTIGESIRRALEFRFSNDEGKQALLGFDKQLSTTSARLGDLFVPGLAAVASGVEPVIKAFQGWIAENERLIATRLGEFLIGTARVLKDAIAPAAVVAASAVAGVRIVLQELSTIGERAGLSDQVDEFLALAEAAKDAGKIDLAQFYLDQAIALRAQGDAVGDVSLQIALAHQKIVDSIGGADAALEQALDNAEKSLGKFTGNAKRSTSATEEQEKLATESLKRWQKRRADLIGEGEQAVAKFREERAKFTEKIGEDQVQEDKRRAGELASLEKERGDRIKDQAREAAGEVKGIFQTLTAGGESLGQKLEKILGSILDKILSQELTSAFESMFDASTPRASGGGGGGLTPGDLIQLADQGLAAGGMVRGPTGRDRVLARLTAGEYVLPKPTVDAIRRGRPASGGGFFLGGLVGKGLGALGLGGAALGPLALGGGFAIQLAKQIAEFFSSPSFEDILREQTRGLGPATDRINVSTFALPSSAQYERWYRDSVEPVRQRSARRGTTNVKR